MELIPMYKGMPFSPVTSLADSIGEADTTITVENGSALPDGPNLAVIGTDESGEVILYAVKAENTLSGCTRGVEGTAQAWNAGTAVGRNWTNQDYQTLLDNIGKLNDGKPDKAKPSAAGNLAALGEDGSLLDSGKKPDDFLLPQKEAKEGNFPAFGPGGVLQDSGKKPDDFVAAQEGKGLSTNDYTNTEKQEVAKVKDKADKVQEAVDGNFAALDADGNLTDSGKKPGDFVAAQEGKGLSTNDYTNQDKAEVAKVKDKADKAKTCLGTLEAASWTGEEAPYFLTLDVEGVHADDSQDIIVSLPSSAADDQEDAYGDAGIKAVSKAEGTVTFRARNGKPTVNIPVQVTILG